MTATQDPQTGQDRARLPTASPVEVRRASWRLVRPHRWLAVRTVTAMVAGTLADLLVPALLGGIVDLVVNRRPAGEITPYVLGLLAAAGVHGVLRGYGVALVGKLGELVLAELREQVMVRALRIPLNDVERAGTGDLLARVGGDVSEVSEAVRRALPELVTSGLVIVLTVVGLAALDPLLALAGLAAVPLHVLAVRWYRKNLPQRYAANRVAEGQLAQQLYDSTTGASTVRAYRLGAGQLRLIERRSNSAVDAMLRTVAGQAAFAHRLNRAELLGLGAILLVGFLLVRGDVTTVGETTAAALYFQRLFGPLNGLLGVLDEAQLAAAALARLVGITELPDPGNGEQQRTLADASVRISGLRYGYQEDHDVLADVALTVRPGERVAVVGPSGAGKTTLAKLIAGVHEPTEGEIRIGGVNLADLDPAAARRAVVLVTQEVHVFAGTLAEDLRLARPDATDEELTHALALVGAQDWASALPQGLDTEVGAGGHTLSTTQSQQLALARIVLADPPIVILDEATAEAGSAGARTLELAADQALAGRTALVIAHRLTQAAAADRIVVLEAGRVVEVGGHQELIATGGVYAALWSAWSQPNSG